MKKKLLLGITLVIMAFGTSAQNYDSGNMGAPDYDGTSASFIMPTWFEGNNHVAPISKSKEIGDDTKDHWPAFCEALGYTNVPSKINIWYYGIKKQTTEGTSTYESPLSYIKANIPEAGTLSIDFYATGSTGIQIRSTLNDPNSILTEAYGSSYTIINVSYSATEATTVYLVPMKDNENKDNNGSLTTGDCMFNRVRFSTGTSNITTATTNSVIATEYYDIAGIKYDEAQSGLNIVKNYFDDGSVEVSKAYIK